MTHAIPTSPFDGVVLRRQERVRSEQPIRVQRVLKAKRTRPADATVCVATGVKAEDGSDTASLPTIIVEKSADERIRRIIVRCPCGRHADLVCEYDEAES